MLRKTGIVIQLRDLQRAEPQNAVLEFVAVALAEALQLGNLHAFDAGHGLGGGHDPAQLNALSEGQFVGMEEPELAVRKPPVAEDFE